MISSTNSSSDDGSLSRSASFCSSRLADPFSLGDRVPFFGLLDFNMAFPSSMDPSLARPRPSPMTVFARIMETTAVRSAQITSELTIASQ